ncbi:conserved protein of unknown function (plasmid) [Rhodovastum atsumiense]|uniref:Uncharacterized protein n=1 Tax=Rhodovastum atsumiense TaxID=504468 RepID=A0A5M6IN02_9PROT|nr:hypothetical protein [Rhodovastum atsumiense]KAA5609634.1 hypothetical protein F1189_23005 [Rhodovastum atsumiense]CAH2606500.1 conserved protein of unknown function [Rhodovastum atsumiense]
MTSVLQKLRARLAAVDWVAVARWVAAKSAERTTRGGALGLLALALGVSISPERLDAIASLIGLAASLWLVVMRERPPGPPPGGQP